MSAATQVWRRAGRARVTRPMVSPEHSRAAQAITERLEATVREVTAEQYPAIWDALNEVGRSLFASEVAEAYVAAPAEDRGPAIVEVLEAWHRSWLVRQDPGYRGAVDRAGNTAEKLGEPVYSMGKLGTRIGL